MFTWIMRNLAVALLYVLLAKASQFWSLPPYHSSPIWPAAGLALAVAYVWGKRILPALLIGTCILRILTHFLFPASPPLPLAEVVTGAVVKGVAVTLQAYAGSWLLKRSIGRRSNLSDYRDIIFFALLAGAAAGLIGGTIQVGYLVATGGILANDAWVHWLVFWAGDVFGVCLFGPMALAVLQHRDPAWSKRLMPILLTLGFCLLASAGLYRWVRSHEMNSFLRSREELVEEKIQHLTTKLNIHVETLNSLRRFFNASKYISRDEFNAYVTEALSQHPTIHGIGWAPLVNETTLPAFNALLGREGLEGLVIRRHPDAQVPVPGRSAPDAYPLTYVRMASGEKPPVGLDLYSEPTRRGFVSRSLASRNAILSFAIELAGIKKRGILIMTPVGANGDMPSGIAIMALGFNLFVQELGFEELNDQGLSLDITEVRSGVAESSPLIRINGHMEGGPELDFKSKVDIGNQSFVVTGRATFRLEGSYQTTQGWAVTFSTLLFSVVIGGFILVLTGTNIRIEREVQVRTGEYRRAKDEAEKASRAKDQFLANISHEMRTPLNGILGSIDVLQDIDMAADQRQITDIIAASGRSLLGIIDDILDFSKIHLGTYRMESAEFSLRRAAEEVIMIIAGDGQQGGPISLQVEPGIPEFVIGDQGRYKQILTNLVGNAVKFSDLGAVNIRLHLEAGGDGSAGRAKARKPLVVVTEVEDFGIGIDPEKFDLIFEPFSQGDLSMTKKYRGTGLGLSICKRLCENMGGDIKVESELGKGSVFSCRLPFSVPKSSRPEAAERLVGSLDTVGLNVLIVEDDEINQLVLRKHLEARGCSISVAADGDAALRFLHDANVEGSGRPVQIVFLDCQMPVMDGYEAARRIRSSALINQQPYIIAVTAHVIELDRDRCFAAGMDDFMTKPVTKARLNEVFMHYQLAIASDKEP